MSNSIKSPLKEGQQPPNKHRNSNQNQASPENCSPDRKAKNNDVVNGLSQNTTIPINPIRKLEITHNANRNLDSLIDSPVSNNLKKPITLPRGGFVVQTKAGNIQFIMPPETVKDCMKLQIETPEHYVFPDKRFDKSNGLNLAEFEFPAYFNFFLKKRQINLVCSQKGENVIRRVFQETLFGPEVIDNDDEFAKSLPPEKRPDLKKELNYFRRNPFNLSELLQIETLLRFTHFNDGGVAKLTNGVEIHEKATNFLVIEENVETYRIPKWTDIDIERSVMIPVDQTSRSSVVFEPPILGVTMLGTSHGFDPLGNTTGMVVWINGRGILVDPPPNSNVHLRRNHVPASLIDAIILSHCHADHDAGTFQKIIEESKVVVMTTKTIMGSFLRKYSAITDLPQEFLRTLFEFRAVKIGEPVRYRGGEFSFSYSLHSLPCIGFELSFAGKSLVFSADTCNDPPRVSRMCEEGVVNEGRRDQLINFPWHHDLILHEAGVPPLHTPFTTFANLPDDVKKRLYLVHVAAKDIPPNLGLQAAKAGMDHTIYLDASPPIHHSAIKLIDLFSSIDLFQTLPMTYASNLLYCSSMRYFEEATVIVEQGAPGDTFFVIASGEVCVEIDGKRSNKIFTVGDYFGEISIFTGDKRTASIVALTDVVIYEFQGDLLRNLLKDTVVVSKLQHVAQMRQLQSWAVISKNSVLHKMTSSQKTQLQSVLHHVHLKPGESLWNAGDDALSAVLVDDGRLVLTVASSKMPEYFESGALVVEIAKVVNNKKHTTTLVAATDSHVFVIHGPDLLDFLNRNPFVRVALWDEKFLR
eukprot:TRINITY_DN483_c0_g2_i1.p1 TRINITY_DN483_c0_g2~~TRINITY_DN483_c0_g2_i1.p1  ORF type:complete len:809 (+),score=173.18 TRINITY_DN483_c0_g2_i1:72-2498(+)